MPDKTKYRISLLFFIIISMLISFPAYSQKEDEKIGLVLSGGGALGMAHIGVLKMIEKYDIPIDYITGTSMGAIIGALYASGYTAAEIETIITSIDWIPLLSDRKERNTIDINDRELFEKSIITLHFEQGKLKLPEGAIYGQNIYNLLSELTWHVRNIDDFTKLPIPFKCLATDLQTGEAVVLEEGNLVDAVRASMAIPSVFSPIESGNRLLVDGGVVRNIPVSDIKRMGADITIVSDVGKPYYSKDELDSLLTVFDQMIKLTFSTANEYELSLADRVITYDLKDYSIASFTENRGIIEKGNEAAADHEEYFRRLSEDFKRRKKTEKPEGKPFIAKHIEIEGNQRIDKETIIRDLGIKTGSEISKEELTHAVSMLYGTGDYDLIRYSAKENTLSMIINEAPGEINSFSVNYNNDESAGVLLNARARGFFLENSTARLKLKLGENYMISLNYSIPVLFNMFDLGFETKYDRKEFYHYDEDGEKIAQIYSDFYTASSFLEYSFFNSFKAGFNAAYNLITYKDQIAPDKIDEDIRFFNTGIYFKLDSMNRSIYPDKGVFMDFKGEYVSFDDFFEIIFEDNRNVKDYFQIKSETEICIPLSSFLTFKPSVSAGFSQFGGNDSAGFFIGGFTENIDKSFISFKGIFPGDINSENAVSSEASVNIMLNKAIVLSPFFSRLYYQIPDDTETISSFGSTLALITPIGPIEIAAAKADVKDFPVFYINIGFNF